MFAGTHSAANGTAVRSNTTEYKMQELSDKLLLSLDEVRTLTGVGRTNLYREIRENRLKARKRGVKTVVAREDLAEWIEQLPPMSPSNKEYK
jgi:excisionase family DNA binding protein